MPFIFYVLPLVLKFSGIIRGSDLAPKELTIGRTIVHGPGCDLIACAGGSIYKLHAKTAARINAEGLDFFKNIKHVKRGDRLNQGWVKCPPFHYGADGNPAHCANLAFISQRKTGNVQPFHHAMKSDPYFVGVGAGTQLTIIITPAAGMVYIGWSD